MRDPIVLSRVVAALSGVFCLSLAAAGWVFDSQLALAQAADSGVDFAGGLLLSWVVQLSRKPRDDNHPLGHTRAEPLGALGIAVLAGMLAVQVASSAVDALSTGQKVQPDPMLLGLFAGKIFFKGLVFRLTRSSGSPAVRALAVDARNDLLVGLVAVVGYLGARLGSADWDAWLSLPVAAWILWSGIELGRENIDLLMGAAPSEQRIEQLAAAALTVPGVLEAHDLRAHHLGAFLSVQVHIGVADDLSLQVAHDIGEQVRERLEEEEDVSDCSVHIDPVAPSVV